MNSSKLSIHFGLVGYQSNERRPTQLLDPLYFNSKAQLLQSLLKKLNFWNYERVIQGRRCQQCGRHYVQYCIDSSIRRCLISIPNLCLLARISTFDHFRVVGGTRYHEITAHVPCLRRPIQGKQLLLAHST